VAGAQRRPEWRWGISSMRQPTGEHTAHSTDGMITISGHSGQSLNTSPTFGPKGSPRRARSIATHNEHRQNCNKDAHGLELDLFSLSPSRTRHHGHSYYRARM
jgi:hypothetical protein